MLKDPGEPVFVEFFGYSASGKSTQCRELERRLSEQGISTTNKTLEIINEKESYRTYTGMVTFALYSIFRYPITSIRLGRAISRSIQRSTGDVVRLWLYCLFLHTLYRRLQKEESVHLIDQGVYQALWSVALTADSCDIHTFRKVLHQFPLPENHVVVIVDVDVDISLERLDTRDGNPSRVETLTAGESSNPSARCRAAFSQVEELIEDHVTSGWLSSIRVNTSANTVEQSTDAIYERIAEECVQ